MTAHRATRTAGRAVPHGVASVATPTTVPATTGQRPAVRPVDAISLALAAAINEIAQRRAAEREGPA